MLLEYAYTNIPRLWRIASETWYKYQRHGADRNSLCAAMLFYSNNVCWNGEERKNQWSLKQSCTSYFALDGDKSFCFNDLQPYLPKLHTEAIEHFVQDISSIVKDCERNQVPQKKRVNYSNITVYKAVLTKHQ